MEDGPGFRSLVWTGFEPDVNRGGAHAGDWILDRLLLSSGVEARHAIDSILPALHGGARDSVTGSLPDKRLQQGILRKLARQAVWAARFPVPRPGRHYSQRDIIIHLDKQRASFVLPCCSALFAGPQTSLPG